jgi:glycosyltransferase involved in cell wall biosynthesis
MHLAFIEDTELHGGTQLWVFDAIKFFLQQGWKITVITPKGGWLANECEEKNLSVMITTYSYSEIISENIEFITLWVQSLNQCEIAICTVHPPRNGFHCAVFAGKCIKSFNLKTKLITKTGTIVTSYLREYYFSNELINSHVVTISKAIFKYLISTYQIPENKIQNIYQGINLDYFSQRKEKKEVLGLKQKFTPIFGCFGYLFERKGQSILLEAFSKVVLHYPMSHLLIVGDGPEEAKLKNITTELDLRGSVTFIPFTRNPVDIYNILDILVVPSLSKEGLPNVILEAFAMKVPVIASNIGGVSEVVKNYNTGYLINPGNVDELANALLEIWEKKEIYQLMSKNGRSLIEGHHDRKKQFFKFKKYFESLAK